MAGVTATIRLESFRADWLTQMPIVSICERYTVTKDQVLRLVRIWELPRRHDRRLRSKPRRQSDPTPRDIEQATLRIQALWDDRVREARRVTKTAHVSYEPVRLDDDAADLLEQWGDE
jgi:hypothetical protein